MFHPLLAFINSPAQLMVVAVLVLILFGAKKLPMFARSLGRSLGEFKRARDDFERELTSAADDSYNKEPEKRLDPPAPEASQSPNPAPVGSSKSD